MILSFSIRVLQHYIVDDLDPVHGTAAGIRVVIDVNRNINQIVPRNHGAIGMIVAPGS